MDCERPRLSVQRLSHKNASSVTPGADGGDCGAFYVTKEDLPEAPDATRGCRPNLYYLRARKRGRERGTLFP